MVWAEFLVPCFYFFCSEKDFGSSSFCFSSSAAVVGAVVFGEVEAAGVAVPGVLEVASVEEVLAVEAVVLAVEARRGDGDG